MSESLRDLVVSLSLNSDNFTRNIKSINRQIQEAESSFKLASTGVAGFECSTEGLSTRLSTLQRTLTLQTDAVGQYQRALEQANNKLSECYNRQNDYASRLEEAKRKQALLKEEVSRTAAKHKEYARTLGESDSVTIASKGSCISLWNEVSGRPPRHTFITTEYGFRRTSSCLTGMSGNNNDLSWRETWNAPFWLPWHGRM